MRSLGNITAPDSNSTEGTTLYITTDEPGSVTLRSYAWFAPPTNFTWDITGSDVEGTMTALTVWSGFSGALAARLWNAQAVQRELKRFKQAAPLRSTWNCKANRLKEAPSCIPFGPQVSALESAVCRQSNTAG